MLSRLCGFPAYVSLSRLTTEPDSSCILCRIKFDPINPAPPVTRIRSFMRRVCARPRIKPFDCNKKGRVSTHPCAPPYYRTDCCGSTGLPSRWGPTTAVILSGIVIVSGAGLHEVRSCAVEGPYVRTRRWTLGSSLPTAVKVLTASYPACLRALSSATPGHEVGFFGNISTDFWPQ